MPRMISFPVFQKKKSCIFYCLCKKSQIKLFFQLFPAFYSISATYYFLIVDMPSHICVLISILALYFPIPMIELKCSSLAVAFPSMILQSFSFDISYLPCLLFAPTAGSPFSSLPKKERQLGKQRRLIFPSLYTQDNLPL